MDEIVCLTIGEIGTNCYLFSYSNCLCVVDPANGSQKLIDTINEVCQRQNLHFESVFLTHGHLDHLAGITKLKQNFPEIKIYISKNDSRCLGEGSYRFQYDDFARAGMGFFVEHLLPDGKDLPAADVLVEDGELLFNSEWKVISTPGHTKGSVCLYNENRRILFTGDTLMFYAYGRTDLFGGNDLEMAESLQKLRSLDEDIVVYPGHDFSPFKLGQSYVWRM